MKFLDQQFKEKGKLVELLQFYSDLENVILKCEGFGVEYETPSGIKKMCL